MKISTSAASRRLGQVRQTFGDELFVRSGADMLPTARMTRLLGPIRGVLEKTRTLLEQEAFDLSTTARCVRIVAPDYAVASLTHHTVRQFTTQAPDSSLSFLPPQSDVFEALRSARVDIALAAVSDVPADCHALRIEPSHNVVLVRENHPLIARVKAGRIVTEAMLTDYKAVTVGAMQAGGRQDERIAPTGQTVGAHMPFASPVPYVLANTDMTYTAPLLSIARLITDSCVPLAALPATSRMPTFSPYLLWHHSTHQDPFLQWVRSLMVQAVNLETQYLQTLLGDGGRLWAHRSRSQGADIG